MKRLVSLFVVIITLFTFIGCTKQDSSPEVNVSINDVVQNIKNKMREDLIAGGVPKDNFKDGILPGYMETELPSDNAGPLTDLFKDEDLEEGVVISHMMNVNSDFIIILKAKDEESVENLLSGLEEMKQQQENIWSSYLPDQYEKVQNNIIKVEGNYLLYVTYDDTLKGNK